MINVHKILVEQTDISMILQVHDELLFEGPRSALEAYRPRLSQAMESVAQLTVPLKVNASIGPNWDEAH
jgi:DNA polymerase-1